MVADNNTPLPFDAPFVPDEAGRRGWNGVLPKRDDGVVRELSDGTFDVLF